MTKNLFTCIIIIFLWAVLEVESSIIVKTKLGQIEGTESETRTGQKYFAFKGIPYAQANRFQEAAGVEPWEGILNGTDDGYVCPQLDISTNQVIGQENCLSLNVYSSDLESLKPVIFFIHGGGFISGAGSSALYGPDHIVPIHNVVLVTINYRLGALGFLSTGNKETPGNLGLLDQLEALRWVRDNVASFGGDETQVTLMGEGAGAASASLLTLTPRSKDLFRNVIAIGGSGLHSQYWQSNPIESIQELGSRLLCSYDDFPQLVDCLRKVEMEKIVKEVSQMFNFFSFPRWFAPTVDHVLFDKPPEEILASGKFVKVPILMGLSKDEGAFYYPLTLNSFNDGNYDGNFIDQRLPRLLPVISEFQSKLFPITKALKKRYFNNIDVDNEDEFRPRYTELLTDLLFTRSTSHYGNLLAHHNIPVYYFQLQYQGSHSVMQVLGDTESKSIAHGDILQYIFSQVLGEEKDLPDDDKRFATATLIPLIVNFVKTSNPTPKNSNFGLTWPKFTADTQTVCGIGRQLTLLPKFRTGILRFWNEEIPKIVSPKKKEEL